MRKLFVKVAVLAGLGALVVHGARSGAPETVPLTVLIFGAAAMRYLARDLVEIVPAIAHLARRRALEPWNGRYYAFDGRQVRLYLVDGTVWVADRDLAGIVVPAPTGQERRQAGPDGTTIPGTKLAGWTEEAVLRMLEVRNANRGGRRELLRFAHWLREDAAPNLRRLPASTTGDGKGR